MIKCLACGAENPDGTKICVKCATELPKPPGKSRPKGPAIAAPAPTYGVKDMGRDMADACILLVILALVIFVFYGQATRWTFRLTEKEEAKIIQPVSSPEAPVVAVKPQKHQTVHKKAIPAKAIVSKPNTERPVVQYGTAETFYNRGKNEFDKRNYHTSFNYLRQALEVDPTFAKAYFGLGYLYARFSMDDTAIRMYKKALDFDPNYAQSIHNLAYMYYRAGNYDDALEMYQKAISLDGQNAIYEYNLGSLYYDKNEMDNALQAFQKASALKPNDPDIYNDLAMTYEKLGRRPEAEDSWQKVLQFSNNADIIQNAKSHLSALQAQG